MILFFTSPIGLGHATRDIAIAEKLGSMQRKILFVSGGAANRLISNSHYRSLDLYVPPMFYVNIRGGLDHSFRWLLCYLSYYKKCKLYASKVLNENLGLIVSDEDFASITIGEKMNRKRILITDITSSHFTNGIASTIEKKMNKKMRERISKCDYVIIPEFGDDRNNILYVGPIVREVNKDRDTLRKEFGFNKKTIVVSIGGTDAGKYLIEKSLEAYQKLKKKLDIDLLLITGPSVKMVSSTDYRTMGFIANLHEYIYSSDLVISLAGRSTMDESMAYGIPGIFIPIKNHFEQEECAKRLGYKYEDIFRLEFLIEEKIGSSIQPLNTDGAKKAANLISKLS